MTPRAQQVYKSARDVWLAGICGGLGEHTTLPSWMWRALFVITAMVTGVGLVAYLALWVFMPKAPLAPPQAQHDAPPEAG